MNKKDYALTKEALAYMGLYEPFYELYCSYKDILLSAQKELTKVNWGYHIQECQKCYEERLEAIGTAVGVFHAVKPPFCVKKVFVFQVGTFGL